MGEREMESRSALRAGEGDADKKAAARKSRKEKERVIHLSRDPPTSS